MPTRGLRQATSSGGPVLFEAARICDGAARSGRDWSPDGKLTLWTSTQTPHYVHRAVAKVLELAPARIRVIATRTAAASAVRAIPSTTRSRSQSSRCSPAVRQDHADAGGGFLLPSRPPSHVDVGQDGCEARRSITGMHFRSLLDGGAYGSYGVASTYYTGALQTVTYHVPRYHFQGARAFTNKAPAPEAWSRHAAAAFCRRKSISTKSRSSWRSIRQSCASDLGAPNSLTANYLRVGSMGLGTCIARSSRDRTGSGSSANCRRPWCRARVLEPTSRRRVADLLEHMPHSGVQLKCDRGGGSRCLRLHRDRPGLGFNPRLHRR